ncbi:3'(2'),5'-bisphosphate nucleotidase CysQ [Beijerinckia sp. L45]|uniref:3'(2'),5'-bisphosphate nucleotidase CysQ n=1 Tax=Beijerinckia sp. L45 TaxID=1641855 RepID=UPI00131AE2D5|nr:3'(2'),5'-bisphosphate nucleotidase CysQ [Beijerinckia sp. L45]
MAQADLATDNLATCPIIDCDAIAEIFAELTLEAAVAVMGVYATDPHARRKADRSFVCDADERAEAIILAGLAVRVPGIPVIAEEAASRGEKPRCGRAFILVDPVDGTREFLHRNGEFTINIALILDGVPRAGAVYAPAISQMWMAGTRAYACTVEPGAALPPVSERRIIAVRANPQQGLTALASRSHADAETEVFLARLPIAERRCAGSSLKFCTIAEGEADVYPRFGPTMEWDTAAGDAVLRAAGGAVLDEVGTALLYGKAQNQYRNGPFVAWGDLDAVPQRRAMRG